MDSNHLWHILQVELDIIKKETDTSHHQALDKAFQSIKNSLENFLNEQVVMGLPHPHPRSRIYRSEPKLWDIQDVTSEKLFKLILERAKQLKRPACVFDLDGTLFDVGPRTLGIIQEWLSSESSKSFNKVLLKKVEKISYAHVGYSLSHAFENAGFDLRDQDVANVFSAIERSWKKKFFDGKSLNKYDILIPHSDYFIKSLHENNIEIFYLTGRHENLMYHGTVEQLKKNLFPLKEKNLILKKSSFIEDQIFKAEEMRKIAQNYDVIANFENEYINLACMSLEIPHALHVIVDSQHSGRPTPELNMPVFRISGFQKNESLLSRD